MPQPLRNDSSHSPHKKLVAFIAPESSAPTLPRHIRLQPSQSLSLRQPVSLLQMSVPTCPKVWKEVPWVSRWGATSWGSRLRASQHGESAEVPPEGLPRTSWVSHRWGVDLGGSTDGGVSRGYSSGGNAWGEVPRSTTCMMRAWVWGVPTVHCLVACADQFQFRVQHQLFCPTNMFLLFSEKFGQEQSSRVAARYNFVLFVTYLM